MKNIRYTEEIPESLREAGKGLPFRVPEHYFDDFQARMQVRLGEEEVLSVNHRSAFVRYIVPALSMAAALAAVFLLVFVPVHMVTKSGSPVKSGITNDEENIINLVEHVDDHTFFNLLEGDIQDEIVEGQELETFIASNYSDYDIYMETKK
jgi:hypothetical protein